jgi:pyruvate/2-oxoglutarate dehydrogenase complex dihydrolipoamide acyltransferase (E2) component
MRLIEEIQIPLLVLPPPERCRLVRWRVTDGSHVTRGEVIFELEAGDAIYEVESFHTGIVKLSGCPGSSYQVGESIGTVVCDELRHGVTMIGVELFPAELSMLDKLRGSSSRREHLTKIVQAALAQENSTGEQVSASDSDKPSN